MPEIVNMLLEHSHRWRSLYIRAMDAPSLYIVISRLRKATAPMLERLELYVDAQPHTVGVLPLVFIDQPPPKLTSVALEGVSFARMIPLLSDLTSLTLARPPRGMDHLSYNAFKNLLRSSSRLKHLTLDCVLPRLLFGIEYEEIVLPHLHSLDLTIATGTEYVLQLFTVLSAPVLRVLRYASRWNLAWGQFETALPILSAKYNDLTELYFTLNLTAPLIQDSVDASFFTAFPNLRLFSLNVFDDRFATYFLLPWIALLSGDAHTEDEMDKWPACAMVWPKLYLLTVRAPYDPESLVALDECLDMLGSLRLSLELPFDLLQSFIFADQTTLSNVVTDDPPAYTR